MLLYLLLTPSCLTLQKRRDEYQQEQRRREQEEIDKKKQIQREKVMRVGMRSWHGVNLPGILFVLCDMCVIVE